MAQEIERKFLVKYIPDIKPIEIRPYVFQGYLSIDSDCEVRISNRRHLTIKKGLGLVRDEIIIKLSDEEYKKLLPLTIGLQIEKERRWIPLPDGLVAELDIYLNKNKGIKTVEVEFLSEEQAKTFIPPDWFDREVTDVFEYKNSSLAK